MNRLSQRMMTTWVELGPRFFPFADAATPDLPLSRLLRLSLIQVSVGMSLVLLVGTLNRVMIVELAVPASLVSIMISLPLLFAPFRALIGFRSDQHKSALGWRRVPYIYRGTMLQFGGLAIMPFALLVLSGGGEAADAPKWIGQSAAALAFLLVGAGIHITQTIGLALATDLAAPESRPRVVGLMYVMLLLGSIVSAMAFGYLLADFSPGRLIQVIQGSALVTIVLNAIALWKQEARRRQPADAIVEPEPTFVEAWQSYASKPHALRALIAVGLGSLAFSMQDVLLEPYGGIMLAMSVSGTTLLTASLAAGALIGFCLASGRAARGTDPFFIAICGTLAGIPAFAAVIAAAPLASQAVFFVGVFAIGLGGGLFAHGTLTATMNLAPHGQAGLALGAWGAVQASAAGAAVALGGILRDLASAATGDTAFGYNFVYSFEILLLLATVALLLPLLSRSAPEVFSPDTQAVKGP